MSLLTQGFEAPAWDPEPAGMGNSLWIRPDASCPESKFTGSSWVYRKGQQSAFCRASWACGG